MKKPPSSRRREPCQGRCDRCGWDGLCDAVDDVPFCPDCLAQLGRGESQAFTARRAGPPQCRCCAAARRKGRTVRFRSVPLGQVVGVELLLCPAHLNDLITASLSVRAVRRLRLHLERRHNLSGSSLFLLNDGWYDEHHTAIAPAFGLQETD